MTRTSSRLSLLLSFIISSTASPFLDTSLAGLIKVTGMFPGSTATLELKDADGNTLLKEDMVDVNRDGMVEFGFIDQDQVKDVLIWKTNTDGARIHYDGKFALGTLPMLEPFSLPTFAALDAALELFAVIDVNALLAVGNPFTTGQVLTIVDGLTPSSPAVMFKDATGFTFPSTPDPFDLDLIATLPDFDGEIGVGTPDEFERVPEPSTMGFLAIAGLILLGASRARQSPERRLAWDGEASGPRRID